ncbi:hypothetical protein F8M41_007408 [Gigaspora margarita]|uniref:Uncharacterized protein n=1 Tax=Gigaspora margarita TaxID=4874 RepID=A0A8H3X4Z4_GIGMA|nr:hypothetical protein F8M41_007408 [Gigaspora margarita]
MNSILELTNLQFQEIIDYGISLKKLSMEVDYVTEISETAHPRKILLILEDSSFRQRSISIMMIHILMKNLIMICILMMRLLRDHIRAKEVLSHDDSDCSHNNDSEEEMPDELDDDRYSRCGG